MPHVLVVDDSHEHLEIIQDIFQAEGFQVTTCDSSVHALTLLANNTYDCVISDLKIPILEGKHLVAIIHDKYPKIPVVVLSGYVDDADDLTEKGAYAVLHKPPNITELVTTVQNAIHDAADSVSFVFTHTDLKKINDTIIARLTALALKKCKGNQAKAAHMLSISRQSFIRYMKKYHLAQE
jgi:DNA-binding NtrC family response regulator